MDVIPTFNSLDTLKMRMICLIAASALALTGCDIPGATSVNTGPVAMTPFTWKANTPLETRRFDIYECELAGRGLPPNATQELIDLTPVGDPAQVATFVRRCLANKGYTQTELPVCQNADYRAGQFVQGADILPPLQRIRCADPVQRGIIVV